MRGGQRTIRGNKRAFWLLALLLSAPSGAAATSKDDPPVFTASQDCAAAWDRYRSDVSPIHFALSRDGRTCAYSLCPTKCRRNRDPYRVLRLCEATAGDQPCTVYAYHGVVVSKEAVTPGGGAAD